MYFVQVLLTIVIIPFLLLSGCKKSSPKPVPPVVTHSSGPTIQIATQEDATISDDQEATGTKELGAVAVKVKV